MHTQPRTVVPLTSVPPHCMWVTINISRGLFCDLTIHLGWARGRAFRLKASVWVRAEHIPLAMSYLCGLIFPSTMTTGNKYWSRACIENALNTLYHINSIEAFKPDWSGIWESFILDGSLMCTGIKDDSELCWFHVLHQKTEGISIPIWGEGIFLIPLLAL